MLFHKLYPVTASTIHNVICAQQTKNVRRAIADVCVLRRVPGTIWEWGGGGEDLRQETTKNGNSNSCKRSFPVDSFSFFCTFVRNVDFRKTREGLEASAACYTFLNCTPMQSKQTKKLL